MSDKTGKQAITKAEVVKAMETIREWCKNLDTIDGACGGCPMRKNCGKFYSPERWVVGK